MNPVAPVRRISPLDEGLNVEAFESAIILLIGKDKLIVGSGCGVPFSGANVQK